MEALKSNAKFGCLLIVDDEPGVVSALVRLFIPLGYQVVTACSAKQGLELMSKNKVDLVISDMRMPEMDGGEFLKNVHDLYPTVITILLTAYADINDAIRALNHGEIFRYVSKPWDNQELIEYVNDGMARKIENDNMQKNLATTKQENNSLSDQNQELLMRLQVSDSNYDDLLEEMDRGREIQQKMLPNEAIKGLPVCGVNVPAKTLSGDFFDYFELNDELVFFHLGDVSGKGLDASLIMSKASGLFRRLAKHYSKLDDILEQLNQELLEIPMPGVFLTMAGGVYNKNTGKISVFNAGHLPILVINSSHEMTTIKSDSIPLGISEESKFEVIELETDIHSLYLFSDGIVETKKDTHTYLGVEGVGELIVANIAQPLDSRISRVIEVVEKLNNAGLDDMTMVALQPDFNNDNKEL